MADEVELKDLSAKPTPPSGPIIVDGRKGGRLNLDADQEQTVTLWAYAATAMCVFTHLYHRVD